MKILLANGCSHTAGTDIDPNNLPKCTDQAWPRWVADHFNIPYVNIAEGGSGNEQISKSTIMAVSNLIEIDNFPSENLIVAICWSGFDRYEYWDEDKHAHKSFALSSTSIVTKPKDLIKKYIEIRSLMEPDYYSNYKNLYYMYTTAKILESYNIKYYFANCLNSFAPPRSLQTSETFIEMYKNILNLYGTRIDKHLGFWNNAETFRTMLQPIKCSPYGNRYHWGTDGQKFYADRFIKHMESVNENPIG
jgi:hypothetical protein